MRISYCRRRRSSCSGQACGRHAQTGDISMTRRLTNRVANFCTSLLLIFLVLSAVSAARADSDDAIVRVKSAVLMAGALPRINADIAGHGIEFLVDDDLPSLGA